MRIVCPVCNAVYQVPDDQLSEGKLVRCARCNTDWTPIAPVPASEPAQAPPPPEPVADAPLPEREPEAAPEPVMTRRMALEETPEVERVAAPVVEAAPRRPFPWLAIAWVSSLVAVGGLCAGLVIGRERLMQAWPPAVRGYAAIGLAKK